MGAAPPERGLEGGWGLGWGDKGGEAERGRQWKRFRDLI